MRKLLFIPLLILVSQIVTGQNIRNWQLELSDTINSTRAEQMLITDTNGVRYFIAIDTFLQNYVDTFAGWSGVDSIVQNSDTSVVVYNSVGGNDTIRFVFTYAGSTVLVRASTAVDRLGIQVTYSVDTAVVGVDIENLPFSVPIDYDQMMVYGLVRDSNYRTSIRNILSLTPFDSLLLAVDPIDSMVQINDTTLVIYSVSYGNDTTDIRWTFAPGTGVDSVNQINDTSFVVYNSDATTDTVRLTFNDVQITGVSNTIAFFNGSGDLSSHNYLKYWDGFDNIITQIGDNATYQQNSYNLLMVNSTTGGVGKWMRLVSYSKDNTLKTVIAFESFANDSNVVIIGGPTKGTSTTEDVDIIELHTTTGRNVKINESEVILDRYGAKGFDPTYHGIIAVEADGSLVEVNPDDFGGASIDSFVQINDTTLVIYSTDGNDTADIRIILTGGGVDSVNQINDTTFVVYSSDPNDTIIISPGAMTGIPNTVSYFNISGNHTSNSLFNVYSANHNKLRAVGTNNAAPGSNAWNTLFSSNYTAGAQKYAIHRSYSFNNSAINYLTYRALTADTNVLYVGGLNLSGSPFNAIDNIQFHTEPGKVAEFTDSTFYLTHYPLKGFGDSYIGILGYAASTGEVVAISPDSLGGTDTNFSNTNLTFAATRTHDIDGNDLRLEDADDIIMNTRLAGSITMYTSGTDQQITLTDSEININSTDENINIVTTGTDAVDYVYIRGDGSNGGLNIDSATLEFETSTSPYVMMYDANDAFVKAMTPTDFESAYGDGNGIYSSSDVVPANTTATGTEFEFIWDSIGLGFLNSKYYTVTTLKDSLELAVTGAHRTFRSGIELVADDTSRAVIGFDVREINATNVMGAELILSVDDGVNAKGDNYIKIAEPNAVKYGNGIEIKSTGTGQSMEIDAEESIKLVADEFIWNADTILDGSGLSGSGNEYIRWVDGNPEFVPTDSLPGGGGSSSDTAKVLFDTDMTFYRQDNGYVMESSDALSKINLMDNGTSTSTHVGIGVSNDNLYLISENDNVWIGAESDGLSISELNLVSSMTNSAIFVWDNSSTLPTTRAAIFGSGAATGNTGAEVSIFGTNASNASDHNRITAMGFDAGGDQATGGDYGSFFGHNAGLNLSGEFNTIIGASSEPASDIDVDYVSVFGAGIVIPNIDSVVYVGSEEQDTIIFGENFRLHIGESLTGKDGYFLRYDETADLWYADTIPVSTIPVIHGEIYQDTSTGTITSPAQNVWDTIVFDSTQFALDVTISNNVITVGDTGTYEIGLFSSFSGAANTTWETAVFVDGVKQENISFNRRLGGTGDVGSASAFGHVNLGTNSTVYAQYRCTNAGSQNFNLAAGNFSVRRVDEDEYIVPHVDPPDVVDNSTALTANYEDKRFGRIIQVDLNSAGSATVNCDNLFQGAVYTLQLHTASNTAVTLASNESETNWKYTDGTNITWSYSVTTGAMISFYFDGTDIWTTIEP